MSNTYDPEEKSFTLSELQEMALKYAHQQYLGRSSIFAVKMEKGVLIVYGTKDEGLLPRAINGVPVCFRAVHTGAFKRK